MGTLDNGKNTRAWKRQRKKENGSSAEGRKETKRAKKEWEAKE